MTQEKFQELILQKFDAIENRLDTIEENVKYIKNSISRIDANIEIIASECGFPYDRKNRVVSTFDPKIA